MPFAIRTIGWNNTPTRDHGSIQSFFDSLTNGNFPDPETIVTGVCYNDGVYDERPFLSGVGSNITGMLLTVADGHWHEGTPGSGVVIRPSVNGGHLLRLASIDAGFRVERLELHGDGRVSTDFNGMVSIESGVSTAYRRHVHLDCMLIHDQPTVSPWRCIRGVSSASRPVMVTNSLIYDIVSSGPATESFAYGVGSDDKVSVINTTIHNVGFTNTTATNFGIAAGGSNTTIENCIVTGIVSGSGPTAQAVDPIATISNTVTDDLTGTITGAPAANNYVNPGTDFRLLPGSPAVGIGDDLRKYILEMTSDLNGTRRAATWDAGCFNNVSGGESVSGPSGLPVGRIVSGGV